MLKSMRLGALLAATASALVLSAPAHAAFFNVPAPVGAFISFGGLDWAWAIPLPLSSEPTALSYQASQGWRVPTAAELASAPNATNFLKAGGNVPFGGTDPVSGATFQVTNAAYTAAGSAGACATPYFSGNYHHCDWQDGNGQTFGPWAGTAGAQTFADQLFVRTNGAVPEPSTWAMMLLGFGLIGAGMRRRQKVAVRYAF